MAVEDDGRLLTIAAPAKINLTLAIKGRRPDGYHEIDSLMQKLELADRLRLGKRPEGVRLNCPGADLPEDENNLAFRAALAFLEKTGIESGVEIVLEKRIPVAAGLGGGSSDGAAVLKGLNRLFGCGLATDELQALALPLGADVPFFVSDFATAQASGIGEILKERPGLGDCLIVLVNPGFPVSTKWVYENFALTSGGNPFILAPGQKAGSDCLVDRDHSPIILENDLEAVTVRRYPEIDEIKQGLVRDGAVGVLMSGSGPTVFGLFIDHGSAVASCERLRRRYGKMVFLTRPLL